MARKRIVRFLKAVVLDDEAGVPVEEVSDFWPAVFGRVPTEPEAPYFDFPHNGHDYRGVLVRGPHQSRPMLYLAKQRDAFDAPSVWQGNDAVPLQVPIHEPLFVMPVENTPAVAVLGTSGAATSTAAARWVTGILEAATRGESIELHPIMRQDQEELLQEAIEGTRLELSLDAEVFQADGGGQIETGLSMAAEGISGVRTVSLGMSFGPGNHSAGSPAIIDTLRNVFRRPGVRAANATVIIPGENGTVRKEYLDMLNARFTTEIEVGGTDTSLSIDSAAPALAEAVRQFKATNEYRSLRHRARVD